MSKNKNLEVKENVDLTLFEGDVQTGFEETNAETFKTPFLRILQGLSPELKKSDPKHIEGAEQGLFCNTATQQLYDSINVIVLKVSHSLIVWKPDRGGFTGRYMKSEEKEIVSSREGLRKWDLNGNDVVDTLEFFCMNADDPSDIFVLPMSQAQIKHGRSWATRIRMLKINGKNIGITWAAVWNLKTVEESNEKGSWYTIGSTPTFERFITKEEKEIIDQHLEMLKKSELDYQAVSEETETELSDEY